MNEGKGPFCGDKIQIAKDGDWERQGIREWKREKKKERKSE